MIAIFYLVLQILKLYSYVVIANVIISWIITLQYDTTVEQLKTIRNQIEDHIKKVRILIQVLE